MSPRQLDGAGVVVVGGHGGLGGPIADELEARGARMMRLSRSTEPSIDLRDVDAGDALVTAAVERFGHLDGVVVAAGIVAFGAVVDTDDAVMEELFLTNALGPLWLARRVLPALQQTGGFFLNVSAVVAERPTAGMVAYSASKAAAAAMIVGLRNELRRTGVTVIDVRPPHTETGLATRPLAGVAGRLPPGKDPVDVARRIVTAIEAGDQELASAAF